MENFTSGAAVGTGSTTVLVGAISLNEWAIIVGIICTVGTFAVNWYYKRKEFILKQQHANDADE